MLNYRRSLMMAQSTDIEILGNSWQDSNPTILDPKEINSISNLSITTNSKTFTLEGITLRGIGDIRDRIYTDQDKVYLEKKFELFESLNTDKVTLNDTLKSNGYGQFYFNRLISDETKKAYSASSDLNIGLCTHDIYSKYAYSAGNGDYALVSGLRVWICNIVFQNASDFNEWLKSNTIKFIYTLAVPITTEITGELAEKILELSRSITNVNNITLSDSYANINII